MSTIQRMALILGPIFLVFTLLLAAPGGMPVAAWHTVGIALWMVCWWSTEVVPISVTALLPMALMPVLQLSPATSLAASYGHPIIFLFFGGFLLGQAMQRWQLHRRVALLILLRAGHDPRRKIVGFMIASAVLSMWVSNTATTILMLPIALSVIAQQSTEQPEASHRFATSLLLAIAYSASIGGMATIIGTAPNALLVAYLQESQGIHIGFAQWMLLGVPVAAVMLLFAAWWLCRGIAAVAAPVSDHEPQLQLAKMGRLGSGERRVLIVFVATAMAWIFRPLLVAVMPGLSDTVIAIVAGVSLFLLPSAGKSSERLLDWNSAEKLPWGVLLLFGGGLALAATIKSSGLAVWFAQNLSSLQTLPVIAVVVAVVALIIFMTEISSNTAITAVFIPLLGAFAVTQDLSPLLYTVPAVLAASCAFMMPVATPPNAIVFSSGELRIKDMIHTGFALNIIGIAVVSTLAYGLLHFFFISAYTG
ncbi:MAG: SLC13 family permease [Spongiibacteraceae bacterium]